jgi:phage terminase large subunit-like protein
MDRNQKIELIQLLEEKERRSRMRPYTWYFPETGPLRRELYQKHMQFFAAGKSYIERLFMAANRVGKTESAGGFETTLHLTGDYPEWWPGKRFDRPIDAWAAGDTTETVRDIIQLKLLGNVGKGEIGTGLIPKSLIVDYSLRRGVSDCVDSVFVKHKTGGVSQLSLKSYDQKRKSFQGTKKDLLWLDEEPPLEIYTECLLRTTDTTGGSENNGLMLLTFTPLMGMSETVMAFLPGGQIKDRDDGTKFVVMATWDDVPHLSQKTRDLLWSSIPPFQRDARSKGIPQLGAGAIYPVPESDILVEDFQIPDHWPRGFAMDVGWKRTAAGWYALDRDNDVLYRIGEHYRGEAEPAIHAHAIKARGSWIPGVIDPAARGRNQIDGTKLLQMYLDLGLDLEPAMNSVESGIYEVWQRMSTGRFKVFKSCANWLFEFRLYRRDEKGRIVKENDHAMDEMRYFVVSGIGRMKTKPVPKTQDEGEFGGGSSGGSQGWMD